MLRRGCQFFLIGAVGALLLSCSKTPSPESAAERPARARDPRLRDAPADDAARYLAGLRGRAASPFKPLESAEEWIDHSRAFDAAWKHWRQKSRAEIDEFQRTELAALSAAPSGVFYPFGGPDALNAVTFFPGREEYLLVGLEPPGTTAADAAQLPLVRQTLESVLHYSFFITDEMNQQLRGQVTDGVLPVILVELVREGFSILSTTPVTLDAGGEITAAQAAPARNAGVTVEFARDAASPVQRLTYLSVNLHDTRLKRNQPFLNFLDHRQRGVTFLKSTSYLMHKSWFSTIRGNVLDRSAAIVQDDSGVPFRFYDPAVWSVQLYGTYENPIGLFKRWQQEELAAAYGTPDTARPLGFRIGYSRKQSNLQVAMRKSAS